MSGYDPGAGYDRGAQEAALRLIIRRCPDLAAEAAMAMRTPDDAARQMRLDRLIPVALQQGRGELSADERQELAEVMWVADDAAATAPSRRTETIRFRVTPDEEARIKDRAARAGTSVSDFLRGLAVGDIR